MSSKEASNRVPEIPAPALEASSSLRLKNDPGQDDFIERTKILHRVGLLLRHIANHGKFKHLPLIRLEQQDDPDD